MKIDSTATPPVNSGTMVRSVPDYFTKDGFEFRKIGRWGMVAMYEQKRVGGSVLGWEVVVLRAGKAHPRDKDQREKERYPCAEDFGTYGWSYGDIESARRKVENLTQIR